MPERYLIGADRLRKQFGDIGNQLPYAISVAINQTAKDIQKAQRRHISGVFESPSSFTKNALFVRRGTKSNPTAIVGFKQVQSRYLGVYEQGGGRRYKRFEARLFYAGIIRRGEYVVPSSDDDRLGSITRGTLTQILSQVKALREGSATDSARSRRSRRRSGSIFVTRRTDANAGRLGLPDGIWRRRNGIIEPLFWIIDKRPQYDSRLQFKDNATRVFNQKIARNLATTFRQVIAGRRRVQF